MTNNTLNEAQTFQKAITAIQSGDKATGQQLLVQILQANPRHETAWLWLSHVLADPAKKRECLERVLTLNPANTQARQALAQLKAETVLSGSEPPVASSPVNAGTGPTQQVAADTSSLPASPPASSKRPMLLGIGLASLVLFCICAIFALRIVWPKSLPDGCPPACSAANLSWTDLSRENFQEANLNSANLRWANLTESNLSGANLQSANLYSAVLRQANLSRADLQDANLNWANLTNANLSRANLRGATLDNAVLSNTILTGATMPDGTIHN